MAEKKAGDFLKKFTYKKKEQVSTGILPLDIILNGGILLGGAYAIASPPGGGKSTLTLQMCKHLCDEGRFVVYADIEQGLSESQIDGAGLSKYLEPISGEDFPRFYWINTLYTYSDFQNLARELVNMKNQGVANYEVLVADSLTTLVAENILQGDCEAATIAADARPLSKLVKSIRPPLGVAGITLFNIAQAGTNIGGGLYDPSWVAKVTKSIEHAVDSLILIEHPQYNKYKIYGTKKTPNGEEQTEIGYWGKVYTTKSRAGLNRVKIDAPLIAGKGIDNVTYLQDVLLKTGVVVKGTKYYKYNDANGEEQAIAGEENYKAFVRENYTTLVELMHNLGYFDLTNDTTLQQVATIEPAEIAGAEVTEEELKNETSSNEQFV